MEWWEDLRKEFPVTKKCVYLDAAYDCGGSYIGKAAAARYFDEWAAAAAQAQRGGPGRAAFFQVAEDTKKELSALLGGVPTKNIAFTKNTNEGFNTILQGFDFKEGDNVLSIREEYPSIVMPCVNASEMRGFECRLLPQPENMLTPVDFIWSGVDEHTVMILVSHVKSQTGYKIDLKELGRRCREKGIFLVVDAVQSMGLEPFNAEEWGVDAVSGAGYKGLGAFISIGFVYLSDALLARVRPAFVSHNFHLSLDLSAETAKILCDDPLNAGKLENCSSDYLGIYVLHDAIKRINQIGVEQIAEHISELYCQLYSGLAMLGYDLITPAEPGERCASVVVRTENAKAIGKYFLDNGVVISAGKLLRFSLAAFSNAADVRRALDVAASCPMR